MMSLVVASKACTLCLVLARVLVLAVRSFPRDRTPVRPPTPIRRRHGGKDGIFFVDMKRRRTPQPHALAVLDAVAATSAHRPSRTLIKLVFLGWYYTSGGRGSGEGEGETRFGCGCRPKTERTRKGAGRLPAATHKNTNRCSRAGPQRRTPTPRAASLACLVRALTARTSSTSMAGFWWSRPSAPRMTCARRFSRKPPAVATGPPSTSARS